MIAIVLCDRHDKPQVGFDHVLLSALITPLDALRQLDFLRCRQQRYPPNILEEQLQRVRRHLTRRQIERRKTIVLVLLFHDLDVSSFERAIDVFDLYIRQIQLVECATELSLRNCASRKV